MRKEYITVLLVILTFQLDAQDTSRLYEVRKEGTTSISYLYGTAHSNDQRLFANNQSVFDKIAACNVFVPEADLSNMIDAISALSESQNKMGEVVIEVLNDILPTYNKRHSIDNLSDKFLKWYIDRTSNGISAPDDASRNALFLDQYLFAHAKKLNKEIRPLETLAEQMKVFYSLNKEQFRVFIERVFQDKPLAVRGASAEDLVSSLSQNRLDELCNILTESYNSVPKSFRPFYNSIFKDRNKTMYASIKKMLPTKSCFIAVGAGHLCGTSGIINSLRNDGYRVTPLSLISKNTISITWKKIETEDYSISIPSSLKINIVQNYYELYLKPNPITFDYDNMGNTIITPAGLVRFSIEEVEETTEAYEDVVGDAADAVAEAAGAIDEKGEIVPPPPPPIKKLKEVDSSKVVVHHADEMPPPKAELKRPKKDNYESLMGSLTDSTTKFLLIFAEKNRNYMLNKAEENRESKKKKMTLDKYGELTVLQDEMLAYIVEKSINGKNFIFTIMGDELAVRAYDWSKFFSSIRIK